MLYLSYERDSQCDGELKSQSFYWSTRVDLLVNTCGLQSCLKSTKSGKNQLFSRKQGAKKASQARVYASWRAVVGKFEKISQFGCQMHLE